METLVFEKYHCPVCGAETERDVLVFLTHARQHIFELLRKSHPEWSAGDDSLGVYEAYYLKQLRQA